MASARIEQMADEYLILVTATGSEKEDVLGKGENHFLAGIDAINTLTQLVSEFDKQVEAISKAIHDYKPITSG